MHERGHALVTLAVKRRKDEDEHAEDDTRAGPALILRAYALYESAHHRVHRREIVGHESAADAQNDIERDLFQHEGVGLAQGDRYDGVESAEHQRHRRRRNGRYEQRDDRRRRDVEHQDLQHEHHARDRSLEYGRHGRARAAAEHQRQFLVIESRHLADIRADGRARENDRSLGTYRTAESDGRGAAHDRAPAVVRRDTRIAPRHGVEHAGHALRDLVLDDVLHEQRGQHDSHGGVHEVEELRPIGGEPRHQSRTHAVEKNLEHARPESRQRAHDHSQQNEQLAVAQTLQSGEKPMRRPVFYGRYRHIDNLIIRSTQRPPRKLNPIYLRGLRGSRVKREPPKTVMPQTLQFYFPCLYISDWRRIMSASSK